MGKRMDGIIAIEFLMKGEESLMEWLIMTFNASMNVAKGTGGCMVPI